MNKGHRPWWQTAIGYQIYPRSFFDTNGDGIGDLKGIEQKLPYLHDLGITVIWICPFFASPMDDYGYDIKDYYQVDPSYGTLDDFFSLIQSAHQFGIKIIIDLVLNHTSDEHKWFIEAKKNRYSKFHQYYIWKEGKVTDEGRLLPPNNWRGYFGDSAWQYDEVAKLFYLKIFSKKMPDLNWEYAPMRHELYRVAKFWLDQGVDGFRLDAIAHLAKDTSFLDSSRPVDADGLVLDSDKFSSLPRLFDYLHEFKIEVLNHYPEVVTIGEVGGNVSPRQSLMYSGYQFGALNMVFNFDTCWENGAYGSEHKSDLEIRTNVIQLKENFYKWYEETLHQAWPPIYWLNHDHPRVLSQYGSVRYRQASAKMLATTLLFLYGTPFIYNGEEIGMSNVDYTKLTQFKDVSALNFAKAASPRLDEKTILQFLRRTSRMNARTPYQWSDEPFAGFSTVEPTFQVNGNYKEVNATQQLTDPHSILNYYKKLIKLRKTPRIQQSILEGHLTLVDRQNPDVFAYLHQHDTSLLIISNFRDYTVEFDIPYLIIEVLAHNYSTIEKRGLRLTLRPFESYVFSVET